MGKWRGVLKSFAKVQFLKFHPPVQLRETVSSFFQKELTPYADQIDKDNTFPKLRVSVNVLYMYLRHSMKIIGFKVLIHIQFTPLIFIAQSSS